MTNAPNDPPAPPTTGAAPSGTTANPQPASSSDEPTPPAPSETSTTPPPDPPVASTPTVDIPAPLSSIDFDVLWDFSQGNESTTSDSSGAHPLDLRAAVLTPDSEQFATGQYLTLAGDASEAVSSDVPLDTSADFSVSAWVRLDSLGDFNTFVAANGEQVSAFYLQKRSDQRLSFTTFPEDATAADPCVTTAEIQPRAGEWYHIVGTRSAASREQRLYVDGVLSGKRICPAGVFQASAGMSLGRGIYAGQSADWMTGAVDEVGLLSSVLSTEQVVDLYGAGRPDADYYLFAYFVEVSQGRGDGLRLAHSHDGLHWGAIGAGKVFMPPSVGGGSFRDPHLMREPSGTYHLVWTTTCVPWAESNCVQDRGLGHATSPDLVEWSAADYVEIDLNVEHVWAPETFFDPKSEQYLLFWSSPPDQDPGASDPHSIYYVLTRDFEIFSEPELLYAQPGRNFIDATIRAHGDGYLMAIKDEADGQKNLRTVSSSQLFGDDAWTAPPSAPITGSYAAEGPSFLERQGQLYVYFDKYGEGAYGALVADTSSNLDQATSWQDVSSSVFFPGVRHGTPIEVPWETFRSVALVAGE